MMVWAKEHRWPTKPVGRKKLGEALGLDDQVLGNLFDGTRNLNVKLFETLWNKLCREVAGIESNELPLPLLLAAIYCQNELITRDPNQKLRSFVLFDDAKYIRFWTWHRQHWASQLRQGTEGWPTWLGDQPLLVSGTGICSSQSSGRSSSPRECQYSSLLGLS